MAIASVYINLEDDVAKIVSRFKHNPAKQAVLVCPKRCFLFNDSINLRLLKKQLDLLGKEVFILTMDERGQMYAKEAGFELKFFPKGKGSAPMSDIKRPAVRSTPNPLESPNPIVNAVNEIKHIAKAIVTPAKIESEVVKKDPQVKSHTKNIPKIQVVDSFFPTEIANDYKQLKQKKGSGQKIVTGVVAVSLIVILLVVFVVLPKASVQVYAKSEPVTRDMEVGISTNITEVDISKLSLPATKVDETVTVTAKYQSQGKKQVGNKARGTVKIYNFTKLPLNLKGSTTTLTVGSKSYVLLTDITGLKPTTYKNAKTKEVDISSLGASIEVEALDGGENFNLPAGTRMEVSNQVFGSKPELLYAKTDTEISGGTTRYLSLISQEDIDNARNDLATKAFSQIQAKIKTSGLTFPEKSYVFEPTSFSTDNPVGAQAPSFQGTMVAKVSGIAYKIADLRTLISKRIKQTLSSNKVLKEKSPESTSIKVKNYDSVNSVAVLVVHFEGRALYDLNLNSVESELVGKSQNEAYEILRSKAEIDRVEITLAPSWQKNFPLFANKIKVEVIKDNTPDY